MQNNIPEVKCKKYILIKGDRSTLFFTIKFQLLYMFIIITIIIIIIIIINQPIEPTIHKMHRMRICLLSNRV